MSRGEKAAQQILDFLYTDLLNVSGTVSASRSREKMFPSTGRVVKRGPGGMFLNS